MRRLVSLLAEARRRRLFRTAGLYIVGAWVLLQVADLALESLELPGALLRYFWLIAFAGFPLALLFGWYFDITADGIRKTPAASDVEAETLAPRIPDYAIIAALAIVAGIITAGLLDQARMDVALFDKAIAVLPLEDLSGEEDQAYFAAGMQDALITSLSRIAALRVVSRTSTLSIDRALSMPEVGRTLGVRYVIEGSVAREANRVRIIVQLIDADSDAHVWADSFDREFSSVLTLQNDMARAIAEAINVKLSDTEESILQEEQPVDPEIYDAYLRGMHLINQQSIDERRRGIAILEEVVENDPQNALAYAGLGYGYAMLGHGAIAEGMSQASKLASRRALELDDSLAEAHLSVGSLELYYERNLPAAERHLRRATELSPSLAEAWLHLAFVTDLHGYSDEALSCGERAVRLDPLSTSTLVNTGALYWVRGRYQEALQYVDKTLQVDPGNGFARWLEGVVYRDAGQLDKALEVGEAIRNDPAWGFTYGLVLARLGRDEEVRSEIRKLEGPPPHVLALAMLNAQLGQNDEVIRWMKVMRDEMPHPWYPWLFGWMPDMQPVSDDPRMRELAEEIGLSHSFAEST